jgi:spermidine/putrescine transport system permease protein
MSTQGKRGGAGRFFQRLYLFLILLFLYAPILTLIVFSFNASKSRARWDGFTLQWYAELFRDPDILNALYVTLGVAVLSAAIATVIGTLGAIGIHRMRRRPRSLFLLVNNLNMLTPDIVIGVSLMLLFLFFKLPLGFFTMLLAHVTFNIPYVVLSVLPKLRQMNESAYEAALDLGASPMQALYKVVLPEILPGILSGALLAFTLSLDDFVISFFTTSQVQNLSTLIYSMAKRGINPTINALSTLLFAAVLLLLLLLNKRTDLAKRS